MHAACFKLLLLLLLLSLCILLHNYWDFFSKMRFKITLEKTVTVIGKNISFSVSWIEL